MAQLRKLQEAGAEDVTGRATRISKQLLDSYQKPAMDPGIGEALDAVVTRRKTEIQP